MSNPCGAPRATLLVEGRACSVHALRGSALGRISGVVVHVGDDHSLAVARQWMPGRIAVVSAAVLSTDCLRRLSGQEGEAPFAGLVVLVEEGDDLGRLGPVDAQVPVVLAGRAADRIWLGRAVHADLSVHPEGQPALDVPPERPRRERHDPVRFGVPGTVQV